MNIHLCGAYVTQIRKLDKHGKPYGPNLCREPLPITETGCNEEGHGHPVNTPGIAVPELAVHRPFEDVDDGQPLKEVCSCGEPDRPGVHRHIWDGPCYEDQGAHIPLDGQPGDSEYPYNVPCPQCPALAYEYCVVDGPRPGEWTRCAWTHDARSLVKPPQAMQEILKEDTFEVNLGPVAPITHIDSAGADATKYPAPPKDRHSWAPDEARRRINDRRFNEPIPDAPDDEE